MPSSFQFTVGLINEKDSPNFKCPLPFQHSSSCCSLGMGNLDLIAIVLLMNHLRAVSAHFCTWNIHVRTALVTGKLGLMGIAVAIVGCLLL
jgi:hypothetical protein